MCFGRPVFPFSFRAEASSRGDRVKNDVPIRLNVKSRNLEASVAVGHPSQLKSDEMTGWRPAQWRNPVDWLDNQVLGGYVRRNIFCG